MKQIVKISSAVQVGIKLLCASLLFAAPLSSQTEMPKSSGSKLKGGFGHLTFGTEQLNLNELNNSLLSNGYGSISLPRLSFGGGGCFVLNNFLFGGGGAWIQKSQTQNQLNTFNLSGGYGYFSFGYVVYAHKRSLFYPTLGIGGGGYTMAIEKKGASSDFSQQLNAPANTSACQAGGWLANFQLSYQYYFLGKNTEGFSIGLSVGYKYSPYSWDLRSSNTNLGNSPKMNMNGLYASIMLGGGGTTRN